MRRKDLSNEYRQFDKMLRTGIQRLGTNPQEPRPKTPFPYVLVWDRLGRKGQRCTIIRLTTRTAQVKFEDGFTSVLSRQAIRRFKP